MVLGATVVISVAWAWAIYAIIKAVPPYHHHVLFRDLDEHLSDASTLLGGHDPYVLRINFNDTTPPFTALFYEPWRLVHGTLRGVAFMWVNLVALAVVLGVTLRSALSRHRPVSVIDLSVGCVVLVAPLFMLGLSQAPTAIVTDRTVGIATGILLTPVSFIVLLFSSGARTVLRFGGGFIATVVIGALVNVHASTIYWFHLLPSGQVTRRVTILGSYADGVGYRGNQSIEAMLARHPFAGHVPLHATWVVVALIVAAVSLGVAWRAQHNEAPVLAVMVLGLCVTAVSPVAWDHHWIFAVLLPVVAIEAWPRWRVLSVASLVALVVAYIHAVPLMNDAPHPAVVATVSAASGMSIVFCLYVAFAGIALWRDARRPVSVSTPPVEVASEA